MSQKRRAKREQKTPRVPKCRHSMKLCFATKKAALTRASLVVAKHGLAIRVYKCPECRCWHLTKSVPRAEETQGYGND